MKTKEAVKTEYVQPIHPNSLINRFIFWGSKTKPLLGRVIYYDGNFFTIKLETSRTIWLKMNDVLDNLAGKPLDGYFQKKNKQEVNDFNVKVIEPKKINVTVFEV